MSMDVMYSSRTDQWSTPQSFFDELDMEFGFTLDPCATDQNHKCKRYFTKQDDGLSQSWGDHIVYCNPPYGRAIKRWVQKCYDEVFHGNVPCAVMLIPARTDTEWFHNYIYHHAEIRFIKGRLRFGDATDNAPFPSMVVVFRKDTK